MKKIFFLLVNPDRKTKKGVPFGINFVTTYTLTTVNKTGFLLKLKLFSKELNHSAIFVHGFSWCINKKDLF